MEFITIDNASEQYYTKYSRRLHTTSLNEHIFKHYVEERFPCITKSEHGILAQDFDFTTCLVEVKLHPTVLHCVVENS